MSQTITSLTIQKRDKERVNVFLDGAFAFAISLNAALDLKKGQQLSAQEVAQLREADEHGRAYNQALHYLGYRPRSQAEVEENLRDKGYGEEAIQTAVERLLAQSYLDDAAFARYWIENRERFRPRGARALRYELRQKGLENEVVDAALTNLDEEESAWAALEPKLARWHNLDENNFRKKAIGFLGRRGFGYEAMRAACERGWAALTAEE